MAVVALLAACKRERPRPSHDAVEFARRAEDQAKIVREFYAGCRVDAPAQEAGDAIVLEKWLGARGVHEVRSRTCWMPMMNAVPAPASPHGRAARAPTEGCACDHELRSPSGKRELVLCTTSEKTMTVIYERREGILEEILALPTHIIEPPRDPYGPLKEEIDWVPPPARRVEPERHWPPPLVYVAPVLADDERLVLMDGPCARCASALSLAQETTTELRQGLVADLAAKWQSQLTAYQRICASVGEWRWKDGELTRITTPYPEPSGPPKPPRRPPIPPLER